MSPEVVTCTCGDEHVHVDGGSIPRDPDPARNRCDCDTLGVVELRTWALSWHNAGHPDRSFGGSR